MNMLRTRRHRAISAWPAAAAAVALLAVVVAAQEPSESPHGDISVDCTACHGTADWKVALPPPGFDHARQAGFPLDGAHVATGCRECHGDLRFARVGSACADCHEDVHRGQLGPRCERCHATSGWRAPDEALAQHAARGFPLVGAHATADCEACHRDRARQEFAGTPTTCWNCHAGDYAATTDPAHVAAGFSTDCTQCHQPVASWRPAFVRHTPRFPLRHAHARAGCLACHAAGYQGTPSDCYACHADDYASAQEPPHAAAGLPTDCARCHGDAGWGDGSFDHGAVTRFPLTGAHLAADCGSCHADGQWSGLPTDCNGCHAGDYATAEPPHAASGFPTTCLACHSTAAWSPANWDHARYFPIDSGAHRGEWTSCADCHVNPADYGAFECINCHAHRQSEMDDKHQGESGYQYLSARCYQCHPTGRGD